MSRINVLSRISFKIKKQMPLLEGLFLSKQFPLKNELHSFIRDPEEYDTLTF